MSVPKNKRTVSEVIYFDFAYKMVEKITKYLLSDFGIKKTYRDLKVFTHKAKMNPLDAKNFEDIVNQYHLDVESSYPEWVMCHYRDTMLNIMDSIIRNISRAHTMYPNSLYEYNVKRQYQTDAISDCFDLKHTLQLAIKIFTNTNLERYIPFVSDIDKEIEYLKTWRKDSNKFKKICIENDIKAKQKTEEKMAEDAEKEKEKHKDKLFLQRIIGTAANLSQNTLVNNLKKTKYYYDNQGHLCSSLFVPAIIIYEDKEMNKIKSIGID